MHAKVSVHACDASCVLSPQHVHRSHAQDWCTRHSLNNPPRKLKDRSPSRNVPLRCSPSNSTQRHLCRQHTLPARFGIWSATNVLPNCTASTPSPSWPNRLAHLCIHRRHHTLAQPSGTKAVKQDHPILLQSLMKRIEHWKCSNCRERHRLGGFVSAWEGVKTLSSTSTYTRKTNAYSFCCS